MSVIRSTAKKAREEIEKRKRVAEEVAKTFKGAAFSNDAGGSKAASAGGKTSSRSDSKSFLRNYLGDTAQRVAESDDSVYSNALNRLGFALPDTAAYAADKARQNVNDVLYKRGTSFNAGDMLQFKGIDTDLGELRSFIESGDVFKNEAVRDVFAQTMGDADGVFDEEEAKSILLGRLGEYEGSIQSTQQTARARSGDKSVLNEVEEGSDPFSLYQRLLRLSGYDDVTGALEQNTMPPSMMRKDVEAPASILPEGYSEEDFRTDIMNMLDNPDRTTEQYLQSAARISEIAGMDATQMKSGDLMGLTWDPEYNASLEALRQPVNTQADMAARLQAYSPEDLKADLLTIEDYYNGNTLVSQTDFQRAVERFKAYSGKNLGEFTEEQIKDGSFTEQGEQQRAGEMEQLNAVTQSVTDGGMTFEEYLRYLEKYAANDMAQNADAVKQAEWENTIEQKYGALDSLPDFKQNSQYDEEFAADPMYALIVGAASPEEAMGLTASGAEDPSGRANEYWTYGIAHMTDAERRRYAYLYYVNGKAAADEYLSDLMWDLGRRRAEEVEQVNAEFADARPVLASAASVISNAARGFAQPLAATRELIAGDVGEYDPMFAFGRAADAARQTVGKKIDEAMGGANIAGIPIGSALYNALMSAADSAMMYPIGAQAGAALMSLEASNAAMQQALEAGRDGKSALLDSAVYGGIEGLTEQLPLEKLFGSVGSPIKYLGQNVATEAAEEAISEIAGTAYDIARYGEDSTFGKLYAQLIAQGYSEGEAMTEAWTQFAKNVAESAAVGGLAGGMGAAPRAAITAATDRKAAKNIQNNDAVDQVLEVARTMEQTPEIRALLDKAKNTSLSKAELGRVFRETAAHLDDSAGTVMSDTLARDVEATLDAKGMKGDAEVIHQTARAVAKAVYKPEMLTAVERENIARSGEAVAALNELTGKIRSFDQLAAKGNKQIRPAAVDMPQTEQDVANIKVEGAKKKNYAGLSVGEVDVSGINMRTLTKHQRYSVAAIGRVAKAVGFNVRFVESVANKEGKYTTENGSWNSDSMTMTLDIHAGSNTASDINYAMMQTAGHELTHYIREFADGEMWQEYQDFVTAHLTGNMGIQSFGDEIQARMANAERQGKTLEYDAALEEVVADASVEALMNISESDLLEIANSNPNFIKRVGGFIKNWVSNVRKMIERAFAGTQTRPEVAIQMRDALDEMSAKWNRMLVQASKNANRARAELESKRTAEAAAERNAQSARAARGNQFTVTDRGAVVAPVVARVMESNAYVAPDNGLFSLRETDAWAKSHREQYPDDKTFEQNHALIEQFDRDVAANSVLRYLVPHGRIPKTVRGPLRNNVEYVYTFDMDTKCERTYQFLAYRDAIQKRIGRQLNEDEARNLIELMRAYGQMIPCTYCYVEGKRMKLAELYMKYIAKNGESIMGAKYSAEQVFDIVEGARSIVSGYLDDRFNVEDNYSLDTSLANDNFAGYRDFDIPITEEAAAQEIYDRYNITDKSAKRVIAGYVAEWVYNRRMDLPMNLVNTDVDFRTDSINEGVLAFHDLAGKAAQGGAKAKGIENYEPYVDQLKNIAIEDKQYMVGMGGIRKHSSNDFQIQNVQDYMLFFMDLAADKRGGIDWTGHTYTKNLDYARIFAPTNDRINVSIAMYGDNKTGIRPNIQEGVEWEELKAVRKQYKNVGAMAMVTNNDQLSFALNSDWIDMVIPFHASGMKRSLYYDVLAWTDYTSKQSERLYTKGQMIDKLRQKGIKVNSSAKAADVQRMFMENFDVKAVYNEKTGKRVAPHFFPGETVQHGVKIPGHNNDAQRYFELCEQYGTNPRFFGVKVQDANGDTIDVTQHPSYLKLIKETARTDSPQEPIVAKFDMDYVNKAMKDFKGYANLAEDSYGIVDEFIREYVGKKRKVGDLTERAKQYKAVREEMAAEEAQKHAEQRSKMLKNINQNNPAGVFDGEFADDSDVKFSLRVTDRDTLDFLDNQETVITYKTMQIVDGKLYPPMAAVVAGKYEDASKLGAWEQATERPDLIKLDSKGRPQFNLNKGKGKGSLNAAYNPYMHSSNLVLNDQFSGAYDRPNLVTVECEVPVSELTSRYHAQYAKDSVGWHAWHTGTVAGALRRKTGIERQVLLSRWIKPVRIVPEAEVAQMYKELLDGTDIAVPDNVVPPALLTELKKAGVKIAVSGRVLDNAEKYSVRDNYSADGMNWAVKEGLLTKADQRVLHKTLADKDYLKYNVAKTKDGKYVIPCETAIVFASGTYKTPVVEDVVIFNVNPRDYDRAIENAMEVLYGDERSYLGRISKYEAHEALEALLQDGSATVFPGPVRSSGESDGHEGRGKGRAGRAAAQRSGERAGEESVDYQLRDPNQISDRELLANAMESAAANADELDFVRRYKNHIADLNEKQMALEDTNQRIVALRKADEKGNRDAILKLQANADTLSKQVDRYDKKLLSFEAAKPLKAVAERERERVRKLGVERTRKVREQYKQKVKDEAQRVREVGERRVERMKESAGKEKYRERIEKDVNTMRTWLTTPTNKGYVPEFLRASLGEFLESLDFSSARSLRGGDATQADARMLAAMERMREALKRVRKDQSGLDSSASEFKGYIDLPGNFEDTFDDLVRSIRATIEGTSGLTDTAINRMTSEQLKTLSESIRAINTAVRNMNRLLVNAKYESAINAAHASMDELDSLGEKKDRIKAVDSVSRFMNWKNAVPFYAFKRFGAGGKAIFEGMMDGWDKLARNAKELIDYADKSYTTKEVRNWSREVHSIELASGETVRMTTAQMMSLYCLSKREQAVGHLMGGGIRVGTISGKGKEIRQSANYTLSMSDLANVSGMLTQRQREVADRLQEFMNTRSAEWGNEVSMKRFGYEMFTEENYFPIETDANNRKAVDEQARENSLFRLLNLSATKPLAPNARNAIVIRDVFDVFTAHCSDMAKYNALGLPILDALKWYNYVERTDNPDGTLNTRSVQKSLESAYGDEAKRYIVNLLRDLNGVNEGGRNDGFINKLISNAKVASVGATARVYLLQATSLPRAAYAISPKYLSMGLASAAASPKRSVEEAERMVGIAQWKALGFYDTNISRSIREMVKHDTNVIGKIREWSMSPAGMMDKLTLGIIYRSVQAEMRSQHSGVAVGSAEYNRMVNNRVREIVYQTQVVDSTMTRSDMMRGKGIATLATAFMSEPTLSMNMLNDSLYEAQMNRRRKEPIGAPMAKFTKAMGVYAFTAVLVAMLESVFDAERDDDEYETFGEKFMSAFITDATDQDSTWKKIAKFMTANLGSNLNPLNNIPVVSDVMSIVEGYDSAPLYTAFVASFKNTWDVYQKYISGEGGYTLYNVIYNALKGVSQMTGLAIGNTTREVVSLWNTFIADRYGKPRIQTYTDSKTQAAQAYYTAIANGDMQRAAFILERARLYGIGEGDVRKAMTGLVKDDYISGEFTETKARDWLAEYAGKDDGDIDGYIRDWTYARETGRQYNDMKADYIAGAMTKEEAQTLLVQYRGYDSEKVYWTLREWDYAADHGGDSDGWTKYSDFLEAAEAGKGYEAYARELLNHGADKSDIARAIAGHFKEEYRAVHGTAAGDRMLEKLLDVYEVIGYDRAYERRYITNNWLE